MSKITDFTPDKGNANKGTPRGLKALDTSLRQYGAGRSILVDKKGRVIAGNKTLERAADIGIDDVIVVESDGTKLVAVKRTDLDLENDGGKARALATYDNRVGQLDLDWDIDALKEVDSDVLKDLWTVEELDKAGIIEKTMGDAEPQIDRAAELQEKWQVKTGDLWRIGDHRLLCGDSTKREDVERVMGGEKARLCFTSPPYADQRTYKIGGFDWLTLMMNVSDRLFEIAGNPADIIINLGMSYKDGQVNYYWNDWLDYVYHLEHPLYGWYVWDKGRGFPGDYHGRLATAHEFLFHFSIGHAQANKWVEKAESSFERNKYKKTVMQRDKDGTFQPIGSLSTIHQLTKIPDSVIRMPQETAAQNHPAVYPVEFPEFGLMTWSNENDIVCDPFVGSGTTIVACQNLGRKCRAIEISPEYCAVTLERMATAFSGIEIERMLD